MHSHIQKLYIFDLLLNFKTTKLSFMEGLYSNKFRHEVLDYTYHNRQIIRDISRTTL